MVLFWILIQGHQVWKKKDILLTAGEILIWTRNEITKGVHVHFARYKNGL